MTKAMTASAIMMLVDEGKVDIDDPVEKYLPEFKGQNVIASTENAPITPRAVVQDSAATPFRVAKLVPSSHPITIREILSHTAGLPGWSKLEPGARDLLPLKSAVASYAAEPLQWQPGLKYSYSNEGYNTAGRIIEVVSGMPYELFLQRRLLDPLGMKDTTFWPSHTQLMRLAKSYLKGPDGKLQEVSVSQLTYPLDSRQGRFPMPAGGLFSTADDIVRFCQMMANEGTFRGRRYLSAKSVKIMTSKETGNVESKPYGFGWNLGDGYFEHGGAYKTYMKVNSTRGLIVVFLVQQADKWPEASQHLLTDSIEQTAVSNFSNALSAH